MIHDLSDLYQEVILDHGKHPRNLRAIEDADRQSEGFNPLCGDRVTIYLKLSDDSIEDISFTGSGCAICTASASMMTQHLKGMSGQEVEQVFNAFRDLVTGESPHVGDDRLGKLTVLGGVRKYPIRVKCATLPWHTMKAALQQTDDVVSTE